MHIPADYQTTYQMLGTWAVAAEKGPGSNEMHVVYASPGTITAYRKGGHYPDGTFILKEVYKAETKPMTTGTVSSRSEEHTSELQSLMRISYAVLCLKTITLQTNFTTIKQQLKGATSYK